MMESSVTTSRLERGAIALAVAFLTFCASLFYVHNVPIGQPPDEWAHLSYVADVASHHRIIPSHTDSIILNSGRQNYLLHPPLYYSALGLIGRSLSWDARADYQAYRLLSAIMVAAGVFLWVLNAFRLKFPPIQAVALTVATLAVPMFPYLAGSINNDNLCYFGVALFFYGFLLLPSSIPRGSYISSAAILIVCLTKATGALFLIAFISAWGLFDRKNAITLIKHKHFRIAAVSAVAICSLYFIPTMVAFHTPFPAPGTIYQEHTPPKDPMNVLRYVSAFAGIMVERLPVILTAKAFFPIDGQFYPCFYLMLLLPAVAWLTSTPFSNDSYKRHLAAAFLVAMAITILANIFVAWRGYLRTGLLAGIQPRYYAYALPGAYLFLFADGAQFRRGKYLLFVFVLLTIFFVATVPPKAAGALLRDPEAARLGRINGSNASLTVPVATARGPVNPRAGFIDRVAIEGKTVRLSGWAIDVASKRPARTLWIALDNRLIGTTHPSAERKDVARAIGSSATYAGFSITIASAPQGLSACDLVIQAEQDSGTLFTLANPSCKQLK